MQNSQGMNNCVYNLLYVQFNEDFGRDSFFSYNLEYPVFYSFKNMYFSVTPSILNYINSTINSDVYTFKNGLLEEEQEYNNSASQNALPKRNYRVISNYAVTFSKNHILSTILSLMGFTGDYGPRYNELYNYNFDLLTGDKIELKDVFNEGVDYSTIVANYVNYKISQNKSLYYDNTVVEIPQDQSFYLTDDGIVIYFALDEIGPQELGIPKFKMSFSKFAPYINNRFYCEADNVYRHFKKRHKHGRNLRKS